jgi:OOP family OmpA-OmpF porin
MFMKKVLFAAALAAACGVASAQGYAGALVGLAKISTDCPAGYSCDDSSTGLKVYGGYEVAPNIAVEVGYTNFGKTKASVGSVSVEGKSTAISVVGAFRFPIAAEFTGVGRIGLASVNGKISGSSGSATVVSESKSKIALYSGLGLEYDIAKDIKAVAAFDLTKTEFEINGTKDSGTTYMFGAGVQAAF